MVELIALRCLKSSIDDQEVSDRAYLKEQLSNTNVEAQQIVFLVLHDELELGYGNPPIRIILFVELLLVLRIGQLAVSLSQTSHS